MKNSAACVRLAALQDENAPADVNAEQATGGEHDAAGGDDARGTEAIDWAAEYRRRRSLTYALLTTKPRDLLLLMRYVLGPMMEYLMSEIEHASMHHHSAMLHRWATTGHYGDDEDFSGKWPLLIAATGSSDLACMRALEEKHKAENLACMHPSCRTIAFNNLAFQMLGREAGLIHETFVKLHGQPKFLLLKLAQDPG